MDEPYQVKHHELNILKEHAPLASQGRCYRILVLDPYYLSAEIEYHLVSQTTSTQDKPMKTIKEIIMPCQQKISKQMLLRTKFFNQIASCAEDTLNQKNISIQKNKHIYLQVLSM